MLQMYKVTCIMSTKLETAVMASSPEEAIQKAELVAMDGGMDESSELVEGLTDWNTSDVTRDLLAKIAECNLLIGDGSTDHSAKEERAELIEMLELGDDPEECEEALAALFEKYGIASND